MKMMSSSDWTAERSKCREEFNKALIRLVLGSLALAWGYLVGEKKLALMEPGKMRTGLFVVASGAIITLCLDALEKFASYRAAHQRTREYKMPEPPDVPFDFLGLKKKSELGKQWVGSATVIGLFAVLLLSLSSPTSHAQAEEFNKPNLANLVGCWCGSRRGNIDYKAFSFTYDSQLLTAQVSEKEKDDGSVETEPCSVTKIEDGDVDLACRNDGSLKVKLPIPSSPNDRLITISWQDPNDHQVQNLVKCPAP